MGTRKVSSRIAKSLVRQIDQGYYDEDCRALGALFQARARLVEHQKNEVAKVDWNDGELATFTRNGESKYPRYLEGATVEIDDVYSSGRHVCIIKELFRKPRGGPPILQSDGSFARSPARYEVGGTIGWVESRNLKPLDDKSKEFEAIRQQYLNP